MIKSCCFEIKAWKENPQIKSDAQGGGGHPCILKVNETWSGEGNSVYIYTEPQSIFLFDNFIH